MGCVESFRGVRSALPKRRSPKRKPKVPLSKRQRTWRATELEPLLATSTGFRKADEPNNGMPEWVASTLSSVAKHMLESSTIDREAVAQSLLGLMVPAPPPAPPDAQHNGVSNNIIDMCDVTSRGNKHEGGADWPQNTNKVRLTTKTMIEKRPQLEDIRNRRRSEICSCTVQIPDGRLDTSHLGVWIISDGHFTKELAERGVCVAKVLRASSFADNNVALKYRLRLLTSCVSSMYWCAGSWILTCAQSAHLLVVLDLMLRKMMYVPRLPDESAESHMTRWARLLRNCRANTHVPTW